ncbi:MAG: PIN domain-containing protein, partial [Bacteroidales bacterium]|nr:PIN domain-containing protein [Bacteroidales bacterium]
LFKGTITPIYNDEILNEYSTVLTRSKFKIAKEKIDAVLTEIKTKGIHSERVNSGETLPDAKDLVFYEVALSKEDSFLVTGNLKHFPKKPFVVSPAEMMEIIHAAMFGGGKILNEPGAMYGRGVYGNW